MKGNERTNNFQSSERRKQHTHVIEKEKKQTQYITVLKERQILNNTIS
jgi:hypothetical protein